MVGLMAANEVDAMQNPQLKRPAHVLPSSSGPYDLHPCLPWTFHCGELIAAILYCMMRCGGI